MTALTADLTLNGEIATVDGPLLVGQSYHLQDEVVLVSGSVTLNYDDVVNGDRWRIRRAQDHTTPATHASGTALTLAREFETGGAGAGGVTVDNQSDPPAEVTSLVAPAATSSSGIAYMRPVIVSATDPADVSWSGDPNYDGVLWLQTDELARFVALRVWESGDGVWLDAGIGDTLAGDSFEMTGYSASGTEGNATFEFGGNPDGIIDLHLKDEDGANDRNYRVRMSNSTLLLSFTDPDAASPINDISLSGSGIGLIGNVGFYESPPVARPVVPLTTPDAQDVIDALVALGLVTQSD